MKEYKGMIFLLQFNVMNLVHEALIGDQFVFQSVRTLKVVVLLPGHLYLGEWIARASGYKSHSESLPLETRVRSYWQVSVSRSGLDLHSSNIYVE
jgi:hypothetical protein